jgi:hypothetical protein
MQKSKVSRWLPEPTNKLSDRSTESPVQQRCTGLLGITPGGVSSWIELLSTRTSSPIDQPLNQVVVSGNSSMPLRSACVSHFSREKFCLQPIQSNCRIGE